MTTHFECADCFQQEKITAFLPKPFQILSIVMVNNHLFQYTCYISLFTLSNEYIDCLRMAAYDTLFKWIYRFDVIPTVEGNILQIHIIYLVYNSEYLITVSSILLFNNQSELKFSIQTLLNTNTIKQPKTKSNLKFFGKRRIIVLGF